MVGVRSIAALVVAAGVLGAGFAATPAAAEEPSRRAATGPGLAFVRLDADGSASAAAGSSSAQASFVAPPNDDFRLRFGPEVSADEREVFEAAAGVWSSVLEVEVPIEVSVSAESFSDPSILGGAAPTELLADDPALPEAGTWYVGALANQFLGADPAPGVPEIDVVISADYEFDEGLDPALARSDRISLLTLALHELGHGLGHTTLAVRRPDGTGSLLYQGLPLAYDLQISDGERIPLVELSPERLGQALTERLLWSGAEATQADGGFRPELFAPRSFQPGSSVSHLDEATYGADLMTPYIAPGEFRTSVPDLTRAMMADFGWGLEVDSRPEQLVTAVTRDFIRRFPTPSEVRAISGELSTGALTQRGLARRYAFSDEWIGAAIDGYYLTTLGRRADDAGRAHWSAALRSGTSSATVAANFFASTEYFVRRGGTNRAWVAALYRDILGREPDAGGWASWTAAADRGVSRLTIAAGFYQAPESRAARVRSLYRDLLGREPEPAGLAHWTEVLRSGRDIDLAIELAASEEYGSRAARRFG